MASDTPFSNLSYQPPNFPAPPTALLQFQALTGIVSPTYFNGPPITKGLLRSSTVLPSVSSFNPHAPSRPAPNHGIYKRTVDEEIKAHFHYNLSKWAVNVFYLLQIIIGAALTALGAAKGPSGAVTVLGAMNTIIAGLLTYLKGQGLPLRLEAYVNQLRALREHIEERERRFMTSDGAGLSVEDEVSRIWEMYQEVRQNAQDKRPGTVKPTRGKNNNILQKPDIERKDVIQPVGDKSPMDVLKHGIQDLREYRSHQQDDRTAEPSSSHPAGGKSPMNILKHGFQDLRDIRNHQHDDRIAGASAPSTAHLSRDVEEHAAGMKDEIEHLGGLMGKLVHKAEHEVTDRHNQVQDEKDKRVESAKQEAGHVGDMVKGALHRGISQLEHKVGSDEAGHS